MAIDQTAAQETVTIATRDGVGIVTLRSPALSRAAKEQLRDGHDINGRQDHGRPAGRPGAWSPLRHTGQVTATAAETPRRRGRPGYDLEAVLRVAVDLFNERGYDGASMDDLSKRLGIAKSAIYHHVASKEDLLRMALDRALDGWSDAAEQARALDAPAIERLEILVRGTVAVLEAQLPYVTLLLRVRGNTPVERSAIARRRSFDRLVANLVEEAERDGDVRADVDPKTTARLLFGMVNSVVEWYRPGNRPAVPGSLADAVCAVAFDGLRVRK
jgi:AcrR family transcriptional regulator